MPHSIPVKKTALLFVLACSGDAPGAPSPPPKPKVPAAADALAKTFAKELVGAIEPIEATADTYAMSLALDFETFVTMELRIDERRSGAWRMTLAGDGTVSACAGARGNHTSAGQYHYEPDPAKRKHSSTDSFQLAALTGTWSVAEGVAAISLDHIGWGSCDATKVVTTGQPIEMRCIGIKPPANVRQKRLACELGAQSQTFGLAMPMTPASRNAPAGPAHSVPEGKQVIFGVPGLKVEVTQGSNAHVPAFTFTPGKVDLVEKDFQRPDKP